MFPTFPKIMPLACVVPLGPFQLLLRLYTCRSVTEEEKKKGAGLSLTREFVVAEGGRVGIVQSLSHSAASHDSSSLTR